MHKEITLKARRAVVVGALGVALTLPAFAQEAVEEVIVTARQRAESISDVPASIKAFSQAEIERAGIERAEDFISLTPGVSMVNTAEVGDTQVSIRGINGSRDAEANFAFIVDGILHTNPSAFNREFADLRQIEILKGPQGAIYGRSASSGAIIVTTNDPTNEYEGSLKLRGGSQDSYFVSAAASGPIVKDQLFGRIHADWRESDGFYKNNFQNDDKIVDDFENWNVNGRVIWEVNDDLKFDFKGHYGEVDAAAISFNAAFALPVFGVFPAGHPFYEDVNEHDFLFQANINPSNEQDSKDFSVKMDWDDVAFGATLTAWFLYSDVEQNFLTDGTSGGFGFFAFSPLTSCPQSAAALAAAGVPFPAPTFNSGNPIPVAIDPTGSLYGPYTATTCDGYQYQERNQEDFSFEIRLTSSSEQRLRWQLGFYYLDLEREVGVATGVDPDGPIPRQFVSPLLEALVHDEFNTEVFAVFGNVQYDITDNLEASVALRYDREDRDVSTRVPPPNVQRSNFIEFTNSAIGLGSCNDGIVGSPLNPAFITDFATCATSNTIPDRDDVWDEIQPKISLRWDANDDLTLFASWGRGFKSGGFNNQGSAATVNVFFNAPAVGAGLSISDDFEKETSDAFEVGFKYNIADGRVQLEGALYHTMIDDMQIFNFFVGPFGLLRVVSNIDEVSITGGELGASFQVTDQVRMFGAISALNGIIDKNSNRPQTEGNEVPYAPAYTLNFGGEFVEPSAFMNADFVARMDYSVVGPTWFSEVQENDQTPTLFTPLGFGLADWSLTKRDSYGLVNARAGFETDTWGVHAWVRNLTNEEYLSEVIPAPEFGGSFIHPGTRRAWGLELSYRF